MRSRTVEIGWEHPDTEEAFRIRCSVTPGTAGVGPSMAGPGEPPEPPEVEVLEVVEDRPGGLARPDLIPLVEARFERLRDRAIERACEDEDGAYHDTMEEARCER